MKSEKIKQLAHQLGEQYQKIEDYFTNGSFVIKFYPFLMYPCVRQAQSLSIKFVAILSIFIGIYYLFTELIAILFSEVSLAAYLHHTSFELSLPNGTIIDNNVTVNSPLSFAMRASFLVQGYLFFFIYLLGVTRITQRFRLISGFSALLFSCGMVILYSTQSGKYIENAVQNLGGSLTFLCGNLAMLMIGFGIKSRRQSTFKNFSILAGLIGTAAIFITLFLPLPYLALFERLGITTIMLWEVALGFAILRQVKK
ncbi:DUF998 domain-containing protein [Ursidibacter maritimus]|uniref:DUF998 domain-containing protein n=1 Tax=Ursidibacter maritimus TaxID=1331689 RepID=A0A949SYR6_9PAST|nr:DUF998 domain-containing protein [Ursidibacter maritimus]KAE9539273.1 hypothetical protein A1D26_04450 [Ursidibacter maritimus]MBV6523906.1 DUF998 domain-containing protein [Ursidibacter maritimus]MBV6525790.1 DUF998 domain-containing protein [Ursidibacter maritimus]MBV6526860.1 DUF998 domain-containing protein [Ursidibacter maritimus]MBV6531298.1 DUF998 domain-containing protein [Ursidibacter maritimus]